MTEEFYAQTVSSVSIAAEESARHHVSAVGHTTNSLIIIHLYHLIIIHYLEKQWRILQKGSQLSH